MPVTNAERINLFTRRVLGSVGLGTRFLAYLEDGIKRHTKAMTTGETPVTDVGSWFAGVGVTDGSGVNMLDFGAMYGVDGGGSVISEAAGGIYTNEVPFEDAAVNYSMAATTGMVPQAMAVNQSDGSPEYDYHELSLAHVDEPSVAVDNGGSITFTLGNHTLDASDDFTGRTAIIWLVNPESPSDATAIETVTISGNQATTTGTLGQSVVSTTAADYAVAIMGPVITRSASVATLAGFAYIGTVSGGGAPRTFDFSAQPLLTTMAEATNMFSGMLHKGWITRSVTSGIGTATLTYGAGEVYSAGKLATVANSTLTGLGIASVSYCAWDPGTGLIAGYATFDAANTGGRVPLTLVRTDGGGFLDMIIDIGWLVKEFNKPLTLTVSEEPDHRGAYTDLGEALARVYALQQSAASPPCATIEIIGDVTVSAEMGEVYHYPHGVTFKGASGLRATRGIQNAVYNLHKGSRIIWSHVNSLFSVAATGGVLNWVFEGLTFQYGGIAASGVCAVVSSQGTGAIQGLAFRGCAFNVAGWYTTGNLPHVIYDSGNGYVTGVEMERCWVFTTDAAVYAAGYIYDVTLDDIIMEQSSGVGPYYAAGGLCYVGINGDQVRIHNIRGTINDQLYRSLGMTGLWISDCHLTSYMVTDAAVVGVGDYSANVQDVRITGNMLHANRSASASQPVMHIKPDTQTTGSRIFIAMNTVRGRGKTNVGHNGIEVDVGSGSVTARGVQILNNYIYNVYEGIVLGGDTSAVLRYAVVSGNIVDAGSTALSVDSGIGYSTFDGNILMSSTSGATVVNYVGGLYSTFYGNVLEQPTGASTALYVDQSYKAVFGNAIDSAAGSYSINGGSLASVAIMGNVVGNDPGAYFPTCYSSTYMGNSGGSLTMGTTDWLTVVGNTQQGSINITNSFETTVVGNYASGDVYVTNDNAVVVGNVVGTSINFSLNVLDGVAVGNVVGTGDIYCNGDEVAIVGNVLSGTTADVVIDSAALDCLIIGNIIDGATGISDSGTNTFYLIAASTANLLT